MNKKIRIALSPFIFIFGILIIVLLTFIFVVPSIMIVSFGCIIISPFIFFLINTTSLKIEYPEPYLDITGKPIIDYAVSFFIPIIIPFTITYNWIENGNVLK